MAPSECPCTFLGRHRLRCQTPPAVLFRTARRGQRQADLMKDELTRRHSRSVAWRRSRRPHERLDRHTQSVRAATIPGNGTAFRAARHGARGGAALTKARARPSTKCRSSLSRRRLRTAAKGLRQIGHNQQARTRKCTAVAISDRAAPPAPALGNSPTGEASRDRRPTTLGGCPPGRPVRLATVLGMQTAAEIGIE